MDSVEKIHDRLKKRYLELLKDGAEALDLELQKEAATKIQGPAETILIVRQVIDVLGGIQTKIVNHQIDSLITVMAEMEFQHFAQDGSQR